MREHSLLDALGCRALPIRHRYGCRGSPIRTIRRTTVAFAGLVLLVAQVAALLLALDTIPAVAFSCIDYRVDWRKRNEFLVVKLTCVGIYTEKSRVAFVLALELTPHIA